jgi:pimeloyl-ACP methyl ester carboxylesterase
LAAVNGGRSFRIIGSPAGSRYPHAEDADMTTTTTTTAALTTSLITIGDVALEVIRSERGGEAGPTVLAAHPADDFGVATVSLLASAAGAPVVGVNPRGNGASSPGLQTLEQMADDIEAVRQRLGLGKLVFWGMSGGGWIGLALAHRHPQAVAGLMLESACACFRARAADPACLLSPLHPSWRPALEARGLIAPGAHDQAPAATEWLEVEGVGAVIRHRGGPALLVSPFPISARMQAVMPALLSFDARPWLARLRMPALVMWGTDDPVVPRAHAQALALGLAAPLTSIAGGGHVPVAQGHPDGAAAVRAFLDLQRRAG